MRIHTSNHYLWEPRVLVIFQVGSENTIHSLDPRMGEQTKSMTTFLYFSYQDILQRGSNCFLRRGLSNASKHYKGSV